MKGFRQRVVSIPLSSRPPSCLLRRQRPILFPLAVHSSLRRDSALTSSARAALASQRRQQNHQEGQGRDVFLWHSITARRKLPRGLCPSDPHILHPQPRRDTEQVFGWTSWPQPASCARALQQYAGHSTTSIHAPSTTEQPGWSWTWPIEPRTLWSRHGS